MSTSQEKGDLLEDVVESIENFLLSQNPGIQYHTLTIERKKRIVQDDVLHEIDLFVKIDMGNGYEAIYIFECKNWKNNVDKNEIIVFSEKIKATNAAKGFFIAKGFSSYAVSQAKKDTRIELAIANDNLDKFPYATLVSSFNSDVKHFDILLFHPGNNISIPVDLTTQSVTLNGEVIDLTHYIESLVNDFVARKYGRSQIDTNLKIVESPENFTVEEPLNDGEHQFKDRVSFHFPDDVTLLLDDAKIGKIHTIIDHTVHIIPPVILWQYDVEKRGRVGYFRYDLPNGSSYSVKMTGKEGLPVYVEVTPNKQ